MFLSLDRHEIFSQEGKEKAKKLFGFFQTVPSESQCQLETAWIPTCRNLGFAWREGIVGHSLISSQMQTNTGAVDSPEGLE